MLPPERSRPPPTQDPHHDQHGEQQEEDPGGDRGAVGEQPPSGVAPEAATPLGRDQRLGAHR